MEHVEKYELQTKVHNFKLGKKKQIQATDTRYIPKETLKHLNEFSRDNAVVMKYKEVRDFLNSDDFKNTLVDGKRYQVNALFDFGWLSLNQFKTKDDFFVDESSLLDYDPSTSGLYAFEVIAI